MKTVVYIAVKPSPPVEIPKADDVAAPASNWGIVAAIIIAAMPHLWQWLGGHQKARNDLTETLLQKLSDSYQLSSASNELFRKMVEGAVERPTELAESNAQALRDIQGEMVDVRTQLLDIKKTVNFISSTITKQSQTR
jgi:hypothetical protein